MGWNVLAVLCLTAAIVVISMSAAGWNFDGSSHNPAKCSVQRLAENLNEKGDFAGGWGPRSVS